MAVKILWHVKWFYISPDTTIAHAADLMRELGLHRLPVIENDKLVGFGDRRMITIAKQSI